MKTPHQLALSVGATIDYKFTAEQLEAFAEAAREDGKEVKPKLEFTPEYADLIERVRKIDPSAAEYLEGEEIRKLSNFYNIGKLGYVMYWGDTPQGHEYWLNIRRELGDN